MPVNKSSSTAAADSHKDQEAHHQDPATGHYPAQTFTFIDPAPASNTLSSNTPGTTGPAAKYPTLPAPIHQSSTIRQPPEYNLDELRSIFPSDLPPRPQPKRNFLTRMLRPRAGSNEDIELGSRVSSPESFWAFMVKDWHFWLAVVLWVMSIGLVGIVYQGMKGKGEIAIDGIEPMDDDGGFQ